MFDKNGSGILLDITNCKLLVWRIKNNSRNIKEMLSFSLNIINVIFILYIIIIKSIIIIFIILLNSFPNFNRIIFWSNMRIIFIYRICPTCIKSKGIMPLDNLELNGHEKYYFGKNKENYLDYLLIQPYFLHQKKMSKLIIYFLLYLVILYFSFHQNLF